MVARLTRRLCSWTLQSHQQGIMQSGSTVSSTSNLAKWINMQPLLVDETEECNHTVSCQGNHTTNDKFCDSKDHCRNRDSDRLCGSCNRIEAHPLVLRALVTTKSWPRELCKKVLGLQDPPCSQTLYVATAFDILPSLYY